MGQAKWIWYPGEFEAYHHMLLSFRRQEFGCDYPCSWHVSRPEASVRFRKRFTALKEGVIRVVTYSKGMVRFGGRLWRVNEDITVPQGTHDISVEIFDLDAFPSCYVNSDLLITDGSWTADPFNAVLLPAACEPAFTSPDEDPRVFPFEYEDIFPVSSETVPEGVLYDFGKESFGPVSVEIPEGESVKLTYGESREEALDFDSAIIREEISPEDERKRPARAFRYICVSGNAAKDVKLSAKLEYLPIGDRAYFSSDDPKDKEIWDLCSRTFHLNTREFFLDGIKRDRWVWSGDAYQSFMIARYLYDDPGVTERTIRALLGKPPYFQHINTINDYSAYLIIGVCEHIEATGRTGFLKTVWESVKALYSFIISRLDENGYVVKREGDWIFVDWGVLDKEGANCFEQIMLWKTCLSMEKLSFLMGESGDFAIRAEKLRQSVLSDFWDSEKGAFVDSFSSGETLRIKADQRLCRAFRLC